MAMALRSSMRFAAQARHLGSAAPVSTIWKTTTPGWHFSVGDKNGFMPTSKPIRRLPEPYSDLERIMQNMPFQLATGEPGLLGQGKLGDAVKTLKQHDVSGVTDPRLITALFRDYSMLASAYLLEPTHQGVLKTKAYSHGRERLPANIAVPLATVSKKLEYFPFLDYAQAYSLNNWYLEDESRGLVFDNMRTIRKFHGGADEQGFVLIHAAMVAHSGKQVAAGQKVITGAEKKDYALLAAGLREHAAFLHKIYDIFVEMWGASSPRAYLTFRTFIMGMTGNEDIFPNGVIYEGVSDEPLRFRGETGAQDSMMPATDNLFQFAYPQNKLTEYLLDLRQYRPKDHRAYLEWLRAAADQVHVKQAVMSTSATAFELLRNLDVVQKFRNQHWSMTKQYIISNTKHAKATGGTPITTWLPNNLGATMEYMVEVCTRVDRLQASGDVLDAAAAEEYGEIKGALNLKLAALQKQVMALQSQFDDGAQEADEFSKRARAATAI